MSPVLAAPFQFPDLGGGVLTVWVWVCTSGNSSKRTTKSTESDNPAIKSFKISPKIPLSLI